MKKIILIIGIVFLGYISKADVTSSVINISYNGTLETVDTSLIRTELQNFLTAISSYTSQDVTISLVYENDRYIFQCVAEDYSWVYVYFVNLDIQNIQLSDSDKSITKTLYNKIIAEI